MSENDVYQVKVKECKDCPVSWEHWSGYYCIATYLAGEKDFRIFSIADVTKKPANRHRPLNFYPPEPPEWCPLRKKKMMLEIDTKSETMPTYSITFSHKTFCPKCNNEVECLRADAPPDVRDMPVFYICFKCELVGQAGVGPVKKG